MNLQLSTPIALIIFSTPIIAMQPDLNNPLSAISTAIFKNLHKNFSLTQQDLRDASNQFKMYRAIRNSPPMQRKKVELKQPEQIEDEFLF